jgi:hypothetical protein
VGKPRRFCNFLQEASPFSYRNVSPPWSGSFTAKILSTPPKVSSTSPSNLATGVPVTTNIRATFLEAGSGIVPDTLTADTFKVVQVKPTGNVPVSGTLGFDEGSQTATFDPSSSLANGLYKATLTTGIKDRAGNALLRDYSWTFTTAGPSKR